MKSCSHVRLDLNLTTRSTNEDWLHDWTERETERIDLVASWETFCNVYRVLEFTDPINDVAKIGEFKWITKEMNRFLSGMRSKLRSCQDISSAMETLRQSYKPTGQVKIDSREQLAFQKLRQTWITRMLRQANELEETYGGER